MHVTVNIPSALRRFTSNASAIKVDAEDVVEAINCVTEQYPQLKPQIFSDDGQIRRFVNIFLNEEDIRYLGQEKTYVRNGDTISIVPAIAGG